jgi:glycosyltransferase involved in cell wall biosynthesis
MMHVAHLFQNAGGFDLIHNQADFVPLAFSRLVEVPLVTTIHGFSSERIFPIYKTYEDRVHYVAISEANRLPNLRYAATIHHGIAVDDFKFDPLGSDNLLFFGRVHPDKGAAEAIRSAESTGRHLIMAGIIQDADYYERHVAPALGRSVTYLGPVGGDERVRVLGSARALLHLINFDEPFGLSVIEALACGTPVIASNRGSMPELITHGVTGFLVNNADEAIDAVNRIDELKRSACRDSIVERFSVERMADQYLRLYSSISH